MNWQLPKTPSYGDSGLVVIDSDDGRRGDFTHWRPTILTKSAQYSGWYPPKVAVICLALNTANIGRDLHLSWDQVHDLRRLGWEINSHGRHHVDLGRHPLTETASAGAQEMKVDTTWFREFVGGYEYIVTDGTNSETIDINAVGSGTITLNTPLQSSWGAGSWVELSEQGKKDLLQGAIDDLAAQGIPCKHHVYAYHAGSHHAYNPESVEIVGQLFLSGRGRAGDLNDSSVDIRNLRSRLLDDSLTTATIDAILDECVLNDKVAIFYGHGETSEVRLSQLEYIIDGCVRRGIRIGTHTDAWKKLTQGKTPE